MKKFNVTVNGVNYDVEVEEIRGGRGPARAAAPRAAAPAPVAPAPAAAPAPAPAAAPAPAPAAGGANVVSAPMPGNVLKVLVNQGDAVKKGQTLLILEAMKMENEIVAPADGTVQSVSAKEGSAVDTGATLVTLG